MAKCTVDPDGKTIRVYSDSGEYLYSYNKNYPDMRFGIAKEKIIGCYKFVVNNDGSSGFVYVGSDS